ncbi:unnamed protein product [Miscanthus lutarioriparius]|uniref:Uncharacterized protein n=1 Tax=Miscanthus lutarioriparius TaxID=422564 RepID=A0A811S3K7_9POAL|nr:unnamed protein product [Miscanthus lutarioriparius]
MSLSKAIGVISGINEFGNLFQLVTSAVSYMRSKWNGSQEKQQLKQEDLLQLQSDLQRLTDTLPAMYNLIDRAEWRIHVPSVAQLLPKLKDAVYDAEDLLDEFRWYKLKLEIEGNNDESQMSPLIDFFHSVTHGSFNKVTDIQTRLGHLSAQLEKMGMHEATPRFDKSVRPPTTSFRTEPNILGRDKELEEVMRLLGVPAPDHGSSSRCRSTSKRKRTASSAADSTEPIRIPSVPVLPIVGIGGVGKTTLAQEITTLPSVKSHFDNNIIWICVSDDFDEERFTKVLIKSLSRKEATADIWMIFNKFLLKKLGKKILLILDDIWPAALNDGQRWRKFCAPLTKVLKGSMLLVTTRFAKVADIVGTMESFVLEGLKEDRCFSFYSVYPKDHNFKKAILAEIWVAEGLVEPQGSIPLQHIGEQYFEDLVNLSFFHKLRGKYVIHDLMHDMALLVSKDECFIVKNTSGIEKVPPNVRHLSILSSSGVKCSDLMCLGKHIKLRTLLCSKNRCFNEVPSSFWSLYNLQILYARKCTFERLHIGASKLINLQKFESRILEMKVDAKELGEQIGFINSFPDIKDLVIHNLGAISKDHAAKVELRKRKDLTSLTLSWFSFISPEHNEIEVLQALQPPTSVESVHIEGYQGEYLPSWFSGSDGLNAIDLEELKVYNCPNITHLLLALSIRKLELNCSSLTILHLSCDHLASIDLQKWSLPVLQELKISNCPCLISIRVGVATDLYLGCSTGKFPFLTHLTVERCYKLETLDDLLTHEHLPDIKDLTILFCPRLNWKSGMMLPSSIQKLNLFECGNLSRSCLGSLTSTSLQPLSG